MQKISELAVDPQSDKIREEALWVMCNIVNCGSNYQAKTLFEMTTFESEGIEQNLLTQALIKKLKTSNDESLINNILEAIQKLFELDEIYGLKEEDSIIENFCESCGLEALDACILRYSASDLDGGEEKSIFVVANELHKVASDHKYGG